MRRSIVGRRTLASAIFTTLAIAGTIGLSGLRGSVHARPPSILLEVPADAFRPVAIPDNVDPTNGETPRGVARRPDGTTELPQQTSLMTQSEPSLALPAPRPSPPAGPVHVVRPGDTLTQIAGWHRVALTTIVAWNPTADPRRLVSGQRILVPGGAPMPAVASKPTSAARTPAPSPVLVSGASGHVWPLPVKGTITTRFSAAHPGIDIAGPAGTSVRAIARGTVVWAGWKTNGGGYVVVVEHPDGMTSTYNHNRRVSVRVGQVVDAGDQVAEVGATGNATGPHLDLRIEMAGRLSDPLRLGWER